MIIQIWIHDGQRLGLVWKRSNGKLMDVTRVYSLRGAAFAWRGNIVGM